MGRYKPLAALFLCFINTEASVHANTDGSVLRLLFVVKPTSNMEVTVTEEMTSRNNQQLRTEPQETVKASRSHLNLVW